MSLLTRMASLVIRIAAPRAPKRPKTLEELVGQSGFVEQVQLILAGVRKGKPLGHILLAGPPGTGKTTIAEVIANEVGGRLIKTEGKSLDSNKAVRLLLAGLQAGDIVFVDEAHGIPRKVQDSLLIPLESDEMEIRTKHGSQRIKLPRWTMIAATTLPQKLDSAFKRRLPNKFMLKLLSPDDLTPIAKGMADSMGLEYTDGAIRMLAEMGHGTPGITKNMLDSAENAMLRMRETGEKSDSVVDEDVVRFMRQKTGRDRMGLDDNQRTILETLERNPPGQKTSLNALSDVTGLDRSAIESSFEPLLVRFGLMRRGHGGREITEKGRTHLRQHSAAA